VYKKRLPIEKLLRTIKQHLGLQEYQSTKIKTQLHHAAAVLFTYSNIVFLQKKKKYKTPEEALRAAKIKKALFFDLCNSSKSLIQSNISAIRSLITAEVLEFHEALLLHVQESHT
jgi:IS4 transposase